MGRIVRGEPHDLISLRDKLGSFCAFLIKLQTYLCLFGVEEVKVRL